MEKAKPTRSRSAQHFHHFEIKGTARASYCVGKIGCSVVVIHLNQFAISDKFVAVAFVEVFAFENPATFAGHAINPKAVNTVTKQCRVFGCRVSIFKATAQIMIVISACYLRVAIATVLRLMGGCITARRVNSTEY